MTINKTHAGIDIFTVAVLLGFIGALDIYWSGIDLGFDHAWGIFPGLLLVLIFHYRGSAFWWKTRLNKKVVIFLRATLILMIMTISEVMIYKSELFAKASGMYGLTPSDILFTKRKRYDDIVCIQIKQEMVFACFDKSNNFIVEKRYKLGPNGKPLFIDNTIPRVDR